MWIFLETVFFRFFACHNIILLEQQNTITYFDVVYDQLTYWQVTILGSKMQWGLSQIVFWVSFTEIVFQNLFT